MIRFKCIYCGQRVLAPDGGVNKKGRCPGCQHMLVVPESTKGRPSISSDYEPMPERPKSPERLPQWKRDKRFGNVRFVPDAQEEAAIELYREGFGFLIPTYDKLSLFLMVVALILLSAISVEMREGMRNLILRLCTEADYVQPLFFLFVITGIIVFSYMMLTIEADLRKRFMLAFAVLANIFGGFIAGAYIIISSAGLNWLVIFPLWNIINSVLLVLVVQYRFIDEECISARKATAFRIILGLAAVCVVLALCNYVFKLYWAITYSICIVYTTSFDRALQNVLPGLTDRGEEQAG